MFKKLALALLAAMGISAAQAQVTVQQNATHLDAATAVAYNAGTATTAAAATITVPSGQYAYITGIGIDLGQNATSAAIANSNTVAMTNVQGGPQWTFSCPATASANCVGVRESFPVPLKSQTPGTNVTLTTGTPTNSIYAVRIYYYLAP